MSCSWARVTALLATHCTSARRLRLAASRPVARNSNGRITITHSRYDGLSTMSQLSDAGFQTHSGRRLSSKLRRIAVRALAGVGWA
ncbi:uncharacterized protein EV422DRAFT_527481 [Fimicolochytrium jonesii]|uniref:uncharacterized protein n=1 Tax=Fimicolochytrium jonesii TaxID=1396493 RepID=UPI0022FE415E|nr:uncharacterized protein EV422DRAFT_527481 [Fimicolochytrium jonesii]KAI8821270.1 hypothetical protein EV422DRAFT_527481 [Fimicolochytrium jonesii]